MPFPRFGRLPPGYVREHGQDVGHLCQEWGDAGQVGQDGGGLLDGLQEHLLHFLAGLVPGWPRAREASSPWAYEAGVAEQGAEPAEGTKPRGSAEANQVVGVATGFVPPRFPAGIRLVKCSACQTFTQLFRAQICSVVP